MNNEGRSRFKGKLPQQYAALGDTSRVMDEALDTLIALSDATAALGEALADPEGRALLIDLIALRHLAVNDASAAAALKPATARRSTLRALATAAALLVALAGGYLLGQYRGADAASTPPAATRVVAPAAAWEDPLPGRLP